MSFSRHNNAAGFQGAPEEVRHQAGRIGDGDRIDILARVDGNLTPNVQLHRAGQALGGKVLRGPRGGGHDGIFDLEVIRHRVKQHAGGVARFCRRLDVQCEQVVVKGQGRDGGSVTPLQIVGRPIWREGFPNKIRIVGNQRTRDLAHSARFDLVGEVVNEFVRRLCRAVVGVRECAGAKIRIARPTR